MLKERQAGYGRDNSDLWEQTMAQTDLAFPIIDNIVIGCPGNSTVTAAFYARLLQMEVIREDWLMIAKSPDSEPRLAFDDDLEPSRTAAWRDRTRPAQLHLDLPTSDLAAAVKLAIRLGATPCEEGSERAILSDPAGHPFCLYADADDHGGDHPLSGRVGRVVVDCADPGAVAGFYADFLDMQQLNDDGDHVVIGRTDGRLPALAFQRSDAAPPRWPDPAFPQQLHLDIWVDICGPHPIASCRPEQSNCRRWEAVARYSLTRLAIRSASVPSPSVQPTSSRP